MSTAAQRRREAQEIRATLENLAQSMEQHEQNIRSTRSLTHTRAFSTVSTLRASMAHASPSVFHVKCKRFYNQEVQDICFDDKNDAFSKVEKLQTCIRAFEDDALSIAKNFLTQYLGDDPSDIEWAEKDEVAYGHCVTITILDTEDSSIALARQEQRMQYLLLTQQLAHFQHPLISVCPRTLVFYKGRAMLVASEIGPLTANSFVDATKLPELKAVFNCINETCNLRKYGKMGEEKEEKITGPQGALAYRAADGRYYINGLAGLMPHFPPARGISLNKDHSLFMRLEAVVDPRAAPQPLSPGAFVCFGARDSADATQDARNCMSQLCTQIVPSVASELDQHPEQTGPEIIEKLHIRGINVALLALVHHHCKNAIVKEVLATEMCARAARDHIRETMATRIDDDDIIESISEFCAEICNEESADTTWTDNILPRLKKKFVGFATLNAMAEKASSTPHSTATPERVVGAHSIGKSILLKRLESLLGFDFSKGVNASGTSPFHFSIQELHPVVKRFVLSPFRVGSSMYMSVGMTSPSLSPRGHAAATKTFKARVNAVAFPSEESINDFIMQRVQVSGSQGVDYAVACYEASVMLHRAGQQDPAMSYIEKCIETCSNSSSLRKSMLINLARGHRGILYTTKGSFGTGVKDLDLAIRCLNSAKFNAEGSVSDSNLNSPVAPSGADSIPPTTLENTIGSASGTVGALRSSGSAYFPKEPHSVVAANLGKHLAQVYEDRGLREEAEPLFRQTLDTYTSIYGDYHAQVSTALNNLAVNLFSQEHYSEAESLYLQDLKVSETLYGKEDLSVANTLNNLACLYDKLERFEESESMYKRDIDISTTALGEKHPDVATSRNNLASSYFQQGRLDEALVEYEKALTVRKNYFGEKHLSVAESLNNLAALYRKQEKLKLANDTWNHALELYEHCVGKTHHSLAPILDNMQSLAEEMGEIERAEELMERVMDIKRAETDVYHAQQNAVNSSQNNGNNTSSKSNGRKSSNSSSGLRVNIV